MGKDFDERFIGRWLINGIAIWAAIEFVPGIDPISRRRRLGDHHRVDLRPCERPDSSGSDVYEPAR